MIDIYCENRKCPICDKEMMSKYHRETDTLFRLDCPNRCYCYTWGNQTKLFFVFEVDFLCRDFIARNQLWEIDDIDRKRIEKAINFWKENDRYIVKLLEN